MEQTMTIKGRKRVSREEIIKVQEKANRKAMTVRRVRTGALIAANVLVSLFVLLPLLYAVSVAVSYTHLKHPIYARPISGICGRPPLHSRNTAACLSSDGI